MAQAVRQLSLLDVSFLQMETPETPMHVAALEIFSPPPDGAEAFLAGIKELYRRKRDQLPVMRWKLGSRPQDFGHPSWFVDEGFDLDRHVTRRTLSAPGDRATLEALVGELHAQPLGRDKPLWETVVIDGLASGEIALYRKLHHAAVDGGATMIMMDVLFGDGAEMAATPATPAGAPLEQLFKRYVETLGDIPAILRSVADAAAQLFTPGAIADWQRLAAPLTPFNVSLGPQRVFAGETLSLDRIKAVAKASGGKVNDVVMALSSAILRRYLQEEGALPRDSLTAMVPVSTRAADDTTASNQVISMVVPLATDADDPKTRIETLMRDGQRAKALSNPIRHLAPLTAGIGGFGSPDLAQNLIGLWARAQLPDVMPPAANLTVSNVPGARRPLHAAGCELRAVYPISIVAHGMGINITVESYCDQLNFGFTTARNALPQPRRLAAMLAGELTQLEQAYGIAA
jgi:WS/DGAT/MGAT family acyltransferase